MLEIFFYIQDNGLPLIIKGVDGNHLLNILELQVWYLSIDFDKYENNILYKLKYVKGVLKETTIIKKQFAYKLIKNIISYEKYLESLKILTLYNVKRVRVSNYIYLVTEKEIPPSSKTRLIDIGLNIDPLTNCFYCTLGNFKD